MIRPLFLCMLFGCEQIEPTGDPLKPVTVDVPVSVDNDAEPVVGIELEDEETFSISSEELAAIADNVPAVEDDGAASDIEPPLAEEVAPPPPPPPQAAAPPPIATPSTWSQAVGKAWPVRLVTTIPNASPPRAILGLPNGEEVVVNPGSMVPDLGLVVVAISPGSAELAKIAPAGDHATIESVTLRAQY